MTMFWDFDSAVSSQRQAAGDHVQVSVNRNLQQQEQLQDPQFSQQSSGNCSSYQRRRCATLSQVMIQYSNQLWKVQTGRTHTISSTETSSQSALSPSVGQNSRQVLIEHHEEIFGKPHMSMRTFAVNGFDLAEKMPCARRPVEATPQRSSFARLRVVLWGSPLSVGRRTRMRSKAEFCFSNGECHSQLGRKASPS